DALRLGRIAGAGFDVLSVEPPHLGNPLLQLKLPNFLLTPHIAWASAGAIQALADQLIENLESFVAGKPKNVVPYARTVSRSRSLHHRHQSRWQSPRSRPKGESHRQQPDRR